MLTSADTVFDAALSLPSELRADLAGQLIASLKEDEPVTLSPAWIAEIERRWKEYADGKVQAVPGEQVLAALRKKQ